MKKRIFTIFGLTVVCIATIFIASSIDTIGGTSVYASSSGSPGGKTNSPLDGANCTQCHSGSPLNSGVGTFTITSNIPGTGYIPGNTYQISAAVLGSGTSIKIGFEITSESATAKAGTVTITDVARTSGAGSSITHTAAGNVAVSAGTNAWQFDWTAPAAGTGNVIFYGAFNVTNSDGSTSGDVINTAIYSVTEGGVGIKENNAFASISLYPNPATNFFQLSSTKNVNNVEVYNLSGQKVLEENSSFDKINIEELSSGVYFIKINSTNETKVEKLSVN